MDWLLSFAVIFGTFLLSRKVRWGWLVLAVGSIGWMYYATTLTPPQWGLLPSSAINLVISLLGYKNWNKEK